MSLNKDTHFNSERLKDLYEQGTLLNIIVSKWRIGLAVDIEGKDLQYTDLESHHGMQCGHPGDAPEYALILSMCQMVSKLIQEIYLLNNLPSGTMKIPTLETVQEQYRIIGQLHHEVQDLRDTEQKRQEWLREAKHAAGYQQNVSFDEVWADALAALRKERGY